VGSRYVFKLAVEGAQGDDGNWYNVVVSGLPDTNTALSGVRVFAYSWTWLVRDWPGEPYEKYRPYLYIHVPAGTTSVQSHFFPDNLPFQNGKECVQICNSSGCLPATEAECWVESDETAATWTIDMSNCELRDPSRSYTIGFWAGDQGGFALPIFSRLTDAPPP